MTLIHGFHSKTGHTFKYEGVPWGILIVSEEKWKSLQIILKIKKKCVKSLLHFLNIMTV